MGSEVLWFNVLDTDVQIHNLYGTEMILFS